MVERDNLVEIGHLLRALEPFLDRLVIIGGWAHRLYRLDNVLIPAYPAIYTTDTDIAVERDQIESDAMVARLREHGFTEDFLGDDQPPVTHYRLGDASDYYAEFLTPSRFGRRKDADTIVVGGVIAQTLGRLEVLMMEPWLITVPAEDKEFTVQVPNPVSFIIHKLLVINERNPHDKPKDILYIHTLWSCTALASMS